jgi:glutamyl-tRNA reductase
MNLLVAGLNHRTAPVELRERLAVQPSEVPALLADLQAHGAKEIVVVSTCNRVEMVAHMSDGTTQEELFNCLLGDRGSPSFEELRGHLYSYRDREAIRHLFRVASSLDSMIVGEPQILGQLKQAVAQARTCGTVGSVLDAVVTRAFHVAKRVRSETEIGQSAVSVSYAAVELAREIFGSLSGKRVLIVGAGKMSEGAARHLLGAGASKIFITNRTPARAQELASLFRGEVVPYEAFTQRLPGIDIALVSSAAPHFVLTREMVARAIEARKNQPMFLIDISVPRNIDPQVNSIEHAFLYDIDDLQRVAERNLKTRRQVAQKAEAIVNEEVAWLEAKLRSRDVTPTILSLQEQLELIRQETFERFRPKLGTLSAAQEEALQALTRALINKIAHGPISEIRRHAATEQAVESGAEGELLNAVRRMFGLRER